MVQLHCSSHSLLGHMLLKCMLLCHFDVNVLSQHQDHSFLFFPRRALEAAIHRQGNWCATQTISDANYISANTWANIQVIAANGGFPIGDKLAVGHCCARQEFFRDIPAEAFNIIPGLLPALIEVNQHNDNVDRVWLAKKTNNKFPLANNPEGYRIAERDMLHVLVFLVATFWVTCRLIRRNSRTTISWANCHL